MSDDIALLTLNAHLKGVSMIEFYDMTMDDIHGNPTPMSKFADTACLVVNVASR